MRTLPYRVAWLAPLVLAAALGGCFGAGEPERDPRAPDRRAPLARLVVDNRTDGTLVVAFRYEDPPAHRVEIGRVGPRESTELPPVPALTPITLEATGDGVNQRLTGQVLEIDELRTWVIADTTHDGTHER